MSSRQNGRHGQHRRGRLERQDGQEPPERWVQRTARLGHHPAIGRIWLAAPLTAAALSLDARAADDARQIVDKAQKRTDATSPRDEGLLQVFDAKAKISDKRWTMARLGADGQSKAVLRFTVPKVKGVALLVVNHPDRASEQWMWTPALRDRF